MRNKLAVLALLLAATVFGYEVAHPRVVYAQGSASNSYGVSAGFLLAQCPSQYVSGFTGFCSTGDGKQYVCLSTNTTCGTATTGWTCIAGAGCSTASAPASVALTINGTTKTLPASFTVSSAAPAVSAN